MKTVIITSLVITLSIFSGCTGFQPTEDPPLAETGLPENTIHTQVESIKILSVYELEKELREEDIFLVNVHIPFEGNIPGTDLFLPYNEIADSISLFPNDKNQTIIVYCKVGAMGLDAAQTLLKLGYTNVWNLTGGYEAWKEAGFPFERSE